MRPIYDLHVFDTFLIAFVCTTALAFLDVL